MLKIRVRACRFKVKVRARVRNSWDTKSLGTKRLGYEMPGSGSPPRDSMASHCTIRLASERLHFRTVMTIIRQSCGVFYNSDFVYEFHDVLTYVER